MPLRPLFLIVGTVISLFLAAVAKAYDYNWIGPAAGNSNLTAPGNWDPAGGPPNPTSDNGYIANGNAAVLNADYPVYRLLVGDMDGVFNNNTLNIPSNKLTINQELYVGMGSENGTINQTGGTLSGNGDIYLGNDWYSYFSTSGLGEGIYNLSGSGTIEASTRSLYAGMSGKGTFHQTDIGTSANFDNVVLGNYELWTGYSEGPGFYYLDNGHLTVTGSFFVGNEYNGTFTMKNSSAASVSGGMFMGTVSSFNTYGQTDTIKVQDSATLNITGGLTLTGNKGVVGTVDQSGGTVTVDQMVSGNTGGSGTNYYHLTGGTLTLGAGDNGAHTVAHFMISSNSLVNTDQTTVPTLMSATDYDVQGGTVNVILGGNGVGLHKTGTGTAILGAANTYTGDTVVDGGKLIVTDLTNSANVTVENDGSELVAHSIQTGTLTLGAGAKVTIGPSSGSAGSLAAVPEPSSATLLTLAGLLFLWRRVLFRRVR